MRQKCDVCGTELSMFGKFRYTGGVICKSCYEKASRQYTETIRNKTLPEIKALCNVKRDLASYENFHRTGKIGNYLLIDEQNLRLCIPCNRMTNQQVAEPYFCDVSDIESCELKYNASLTMDELEHLVKEQKSEQTINHLRVELRFKNGYKNINLLTRPVRIKSFAFRQSFQFAKRIETEIKRLMEICPVLG